MHTHIYACMHTYSRKLQPTEKVREGWLNKKGRRGWRRHYFIVHDDGRFMWVREPPHRCLEREQEMEERRMATLQYAVAVRDLPDAGVKPHLFALIHTTNSPAGDPEELMLAADSAREKKEWIETLSSWISTPSISATSPTPPFRARRSATSARQS